jgi:hypothetical protein
MAKTERPRGILRNLIQEKVEEPAPCSPEKFKTSKDGISGDPEPFKIGKAGHVRQFSLTKSKRSDIDKASSREHGRAKTSKIFSDQYKILIVGLDKNSKIFFLVNGQIRMMRHRSMGGSWGMSESLI